MISMLQDLHIRVEVPGFPSRDSTENSEAIEWGARIVDQFQFSAVMPGEFLFLTKKEHVGKFDNGIEEDPDAITFISPYHTDLPWPEELDGYSLSNRLDIELQKGDEPKLQLLPVLQDTDASIYSTIEEWIHHGGNISELVKVRVYPNGSMKDVGSVLHSDGTLVITAPEFNKLYTISVYVNLRTINVIREGKNKKFIGTIEQDQVGL